MSATMTRRTGWILLGLGLLSLVTLAGPRPATAAGLEQLDNSLKFVPADVAFYGASFRLGEQWSAIVKSRAWAKLQALPLLKMAWGMYDLQAAMPGSWANQAQIFLADPQVREVLDVLQELASEEIFMTGDEHCVKVLELLQTINSSNRFGRLSQQLGGNEDPMAQVGLLLSILHDELDELEVPGVVTGFRLKNRERVAKQLQRLEAVLQQVVAAVPELNGRLKHTKIGKYDYLTLSLDGSLVPWSEVSDQLQQFEEEEGQVKEIVERLKKMTYVVAVGIRENYLLISCGPDTAGLAHLGQDSLLVQRPEFKPLAPLAAQRLLSVQYLSAALHAASQSTSRDIDDLVHWFTDDLLPEIPLDDEQQERIEKDVTALGKDVQRFLPEPGAVSAVSFAKAGGVETYTYDWSKYPGMAAPKPLTLLDHVGGSPLLGLVGRCEFTVADYDLLVKWAQIGLGYFRDFAVPQMDEEEQAKVKKFLNKARGPLKKFDQAVREQLIPALADGQCGLVLDGKLKSKQFCNDAPQTAEALPMAEPALVIGLASAEKFHRGAIQCRDAINGLLRALHDSDPDNVPELSIPDPDQATVAGGMLYSYALPSEWGIDGQILPNAALGDQLVCLSASRAHSERLLKAMPLQAPGVLADAKQPRVLGVVFDWATLVDTATPWVRMATEAILRENFGMLDGGPAKEQSQAIKDQVDTVLEVLKVFRAYSGEAHVEGGVLVSHGRLELRDVER